jgi:hypothetical protein
MRGTAAVGEMIERSGKRGGWSKKAAIKRAAEIERFVRTEWAD